MFNLTKDDFLVICSAINGVKCTVNTFVDNIIFSEEFANYPHQESLADKINFFTDTQLSVLFITVQQFWDTENRFNTDERLKELGITFGSW